MTRQEIVERIRKLTENQFYRINGEATEIDEADLYGDDEARDEAIASLVCIVLGIDEGDDK